ncbi:MAG: hypothetical protein JRF62_07625 [Deltaproteobacteria bacterium]|nr:hypothetical protein [Deltaproteobacteria bacterium]MBW2640697.1 hypothetical protein [Deltaproteobacteria bacterium]MBW2679652.1 hypothetical protein [Deltaproteobacteria bacterium]RLC12444.1 MAG: hypothetical protein DRI24_17385 [Deltaproteobacteria bacterium]
MLIIREDQMEVLGNYMLNKFENALVTHLNLYFPEKCEAMGESGVREMIRHGIAQAKSYGIVIEYQVSRYINLMFMLGKDFDTDSALPWASEILLNSSFEGTFAKIETLCRAADTHSK